MVEKIGKSPLKERYVQKCPIIIMKPKQNVSSKLSEMTITSV